jgi:hypothetical protein
MDLFPETLDDPLHGFIPRITFVEHAHFGVEAQPFLLEFGVSFDLAFESFNLLLAFA